MARQREIRGPTGGAGRRRKYAKPRIISCSAEELLERLGTARACSFQHSVISCSGKQYSSKEVNKE